VTYKVQHPLTALPIALDEARIYVLPGREAAAINAVHWEFYELIRAFDRGELPSCCGRATRDPGGEKTLQKPGMANHSSSL
jgi:hypothetical protein